MGRVVLLLECNPCGCWMLLRSLGDGVPGAAKVADAVGDMGGVPKDDMCSSLSSPGGVPRVMSS